MIKLNIISQKTKTILLTILISLLVAYLIFGIIYITLYKDYIEVDLTISQITDDKVYVDYTYKGSDYLHRKITSYSDNYVVGMGIKGFINPNNYEEMHSLGDLIIIPAIILVFIAWYSMITIVLVVQRNLRIKKTIKFRTLGKLYKAKIVGIKRGNYNNNQAYVLQATINGQTYESDEIRGKIKEFNEEIIKNHYVVNLYIIGNNSFVDIDTIKKFHEIDDVLNEITIGKDE